MMAAGIVVFCLFSSILSTVASLKCQTCLVSGNECKEEDVKMVECKDNEEVCFSIIVNTTLTNVSMSLVIKGCSKPEECYEGFYSTTTVDGRFELAKTYCCQTDGCNAKPLLLQNYDELQPNGLQCPGCYVQDADSCEGHQPVICIDKEDQCLNLTSSMQACLLHGLAEAWLVTWNKRVAEAFGRVISLQPPLSHRFHRFPWFMEELRKIKQEKRCLEHHRRSMRDELDQTRVRAAIKAYLVAVRAMKRQYFSALIASADSRPEALFRVTRALLGKEDSEVHLQGHAEEFAEHLTQNHLNLFPGHLQSGLL